jgi:hypothetical protein
MCRFSLSCPGLALPELVWPWNPGLFFSWLELPNFLKFVNQATRYSLNSSCQLMGSSIEVKFPESMIRTGAELKKKTE